jgi:hypothetical protein
VTYTNLNFIIKNYEHHLERHYEIESNKNCFLQYIYVSDEFYDERFNHCLGLSEDFNLKTFLLDEYGEHNSFSDFMYLQKRSFTSFFRENNVDIPNCFRKTLSVKNPINEVKLLKFNNYLMRHGKRLQVMSILLNVIFDQYTNPENLDLRNLKTNYSWKTFFLILNSMTYVEKQAQLLPLVDEESSTYNHIVSNTTKSIEKVWDFNK